MSGIDDAYLAFLARKLEEGKRGHTRVYLLGVPNAGKSTLFNRWLGEGAAQVSAKPQQTTAFQTGTRGGVSFVDTPPLGISPERDREIFERVDAEAGVVLYLVSGTSGISQADVDAMQRLEVPTIVAINRVDVLDEGEIERTRTEIEEKLGVSREEIVFCSAKSGEGQEALAFRLLSAVASPEEVRQCFPDMLQGGNSPGELFPRRARQFQQRYGEAPRVIVTGMPKSGKSSVLNAILGEEVRPVSAGRGSQSDFFEVGRWGITFVEAPPFSPDRRKNDRILREGIAPAHLVIHVMNGAVGFTKIDAMACRLIRPHRPFLLLVNKIDVLEAGEQDALLAAIRRGGGEIEQEILLLSARKGRYLDLLRKRIGNILGKGDLRFRDLPLDLLDHFQRGLYTRPAQEERRVAVVPKPTRRADAVRRARRVVRRNAALAAGCALAPLPIADIGPILAIQSEMVIEIALLFGHEISMRRAREIVTTVAGGIAIKGLARGLIRLAPLIGPVITTGTVYAGTLAMGEIAIQYFKGGMRDDLTTMKKKFEEMEVPEEKKL